MRTTRLCAGLFAVVALTASAAACSDDDGATETGIPDDAAFCSDAPDSSDEVSEDYVGSAEHVEDLRRLRMEAPTELRDDLDLAITHFDEAVDPADPDSQLTENFPDPVNAALQRVTTYIGANCVE